MFGEGAPLTVYPARSLGVRAQFAVLGLAGAGLAAVGGVCTALGAWPVLIPVGTAEVALCAAFALCARKAGQAQRLSLEGQDLHVDTCSPYRRRISRVTLAATRTRVDLQEQLHAMPDEFVGEGAVMTYRLSLSDGRASVFIGDFLPPEERPILGEAIKAGLSPYRLTGRHI